MRKYFITILVVVFIMMMTTACDSRKTDYLTYADDGEVGVDITEELDYTEVVENYCESENITIVVYVCGAVVTPGVYYFDEGDIKDSAIKAAGGFTEEAVTDYVNLAEKLKDGERLYVPCMSELEMGIVSYPDDSGDNTVTNAVDSDGRVNINTAGKDELMTLPGIGESKADLIITYRTENGSFNSTEELMNINGIKEGVYGRIKDRITVN